MLTMRAGLATLETVVGQRTTSTYDDPLLPLADLVASRRAPEMPDLPLPRFTGGAVGYLSYEAVRAFEPRVRRRDLVSISRTASGCLPTRCWFSITWRGRSRLWPMWHWTATLLWRIPTTEPKPRSTNSSPASAPFSRQCRSAVNSRTGRPMSARSRIPLMSDIWRWLRRRGSTLRPGISSRSFSHSASTSPAMSTHSRSIVPCERSTRRHTCSISISSTTRSLGRRLSF